MSSTALLLQEAISLHRNGAIAEAAARYEQVLRKDADNVEALFYAGLAHCQRGQFAQAVVPLRRAVKLAPTQAGAHNLLGLALKDLGRTDEALLSFDQAIALQPDFLNAHVARAAALMATGRWAEAVTGQDRALALAPDNIELWCNRGVALAGLARHADAIASYDRALALKPNLTEAHANRGNALAALGRDEEAIAAFDRALAVRADFAAVHVNRGNSLRRLMRLDEAAVSYGHAVRLAPNLAEAHASLGLVQAELGRCVEAVESYDRALAQQSTPPAPHDVTAVILSHRAWAANQSGRFDDAFTSMRRALELAPDHDGIRFQASFIELLHGRWTDAWPKHESASRYGAGLLAEFAGKSWPRWNGEQLADELLVLVTEQGLGDAIQFSLFAAALASRGQRVAIFTSPQLAPLLAGVRGVERVVTSFDALAGEPKLAWAPLMSVPAILGTTPDTVPSVPSYISIDPAHVATWRERLGGEGLKIGIAWQGDVKNMNDRNRSIPLQRWAPLADIPGVRLISLQRGAGSEQTATVAFRDRIETPLDPADLGAAALHDTAALVANLDLVVSIDSMLAHLAGALGRPTIVALRHVPEWRWLLDRDDSPWYPTARLARQSSEGDWDGVMQRIAQTVRERAAAARSN